MHTQGWDAESYPFSPSNPVPRNVCFQTGGEVYLREEGYYRCRMALESGTRMVGLNIFYEMGQLMRVAEELGHSTRDLSHLLFDCLANGQIVDLGLMESIIAVATVGYTPPLGQRSLGALYKKYTGKVLDGKWGLSNWRLRYNELDGVPVAEWPKEAYDYAQGDDLASLEIWHAMQKRMRRKVKDWQGWTIDLWDGDLPKGYLFQVTAAWCLYLTGVSGLDVDPEALDAYEVRVQAQYDEAVEYLKGCGIVRECGTENRAAMRAMITAAYNGDPPRTKPTKSHPKGQVATNEDARKQALVVTPALEVYGKYSKAKQALSTYIKPLRNALADGGIVTYSTDPYKATARPSASKPNIYNVPKYVGPRECYVAPEGYVFNIRDFATMEIKSWAQSALDLYGLESTALLNYQRDPKFDFHSWMASHLVRYFFGLDYAYEGILAVKGDPTHPHYEQVNMARTAAKPTDFGGIGGMMPRALMVSGRKYGVNFSLDQAKDVWNIWRNSDKAHAEWVNIAKRAAPRGRAPTLHMPRTGLTRAQMRMTTMCNHPFQHLSACSGKDALYRVMRLCHGLDEQGSPLDGSKPLVYLYDELVVLTPEDRAVAAMAQQEQVMNQAANDWHPDVPCYTDGETCKRWSKKAWSKDGSIWEGQPDAVENLVARAEAASTMVLDLGARVPRGRKVLLNQWGGPLGDIVTEGEDRGKFTARFDSKEVMHYLTRQGLVRDGRAVTPAANSSTRS